jgi:protein-S-isoprenylcysteine O-methyltransferase Ste14
VISAHRRTLVVNGLLVALCLGFAYANLARWRETGTPVGLGAVLLESFTAGLFLMRRSPQATSSRPLAWIAALLGAFTMLGARPVAHPAAGPFELFEVVQLAGFGIVLVALGALGRSFGIVAANRGIKTSGLYGFVRHPAYAGYLVSYLGYVAENASLRNAILLVIATGGQLVRMSEEERMLRLDAAYSDYLTKVRRRLIPYLY